MEEVILVPRNFSEVELIDVLVVLAWLDLVDVAAETVEARDKLLQVGNDIHSVVCVISETV